MATHAQTFQTLKNAHSVADYVIWADVVYVDVRSLMLTQCRKSATKTEFQLQCLKLGCAVHVKHVLFVFMVGMCGN